MPASAAQVFGPVTVNPDFTSIGEKTLLTMNTTLPSGGKNVIIVSFLSNVAGGPLATFRLKKGTTVLYETFLIHIFDGWGQRGKPIMVIAVDNNPSGNDSYTFTINITVAGPSSGNVHVQGIVIKGDYEDVTWSYNTTAVAIAGGATSTVTSQTVNYPAGSKVAVIAMVYGQSTLGDLRIGAGNMKIKKGTAVVASNQFNIGTRSDFPTPSWMNLAWLDTNSGSVTYSVEVTNGSTATINFYASLVSFVVFDGAFLDTASVALSNGVQVTVGNLSTTLTGDVAVIGLAAVENASSISGLVFNVGDVVLQRDGATTGQISNSGSLWALDFTGQHSRSGVLPLFRIDTNVTNPSYQIKMTARASGINGEAKILAFDLFTGVAIKKVFGETVRETEGTTFVRGRFRVSAELVNLSELRGLARNFVRLPLEAVNLIESVVGARIWNKVVGEVENVSEAFRILRGRFRQVLESLDVSEAMTRVSQLFREVSESVSLIEIASRARMMARILGEVVQSLEATVRSRIIARATSEAMNIFESFNSAIGKVAGIIEGIHLSESVRRVRNLARIVTEQVKTSETISRSVEFVKILTETQYLSEALRAVRNMFRSVGESLRIPEVTTSFKGIVGVVGEVVSLDEISQSLRSLFRQATEAVTIGEIFARIRLMVRAVSEGVSVLENLMVTRFLARVIGEVSHISETLERFKGLALSVSESVKLSEYKMFKAVKTFIRRLVSTLRGRVRGGGV